jgi:hypothetical protein
MTRRSVVSFLFFFLSATPVFLPADNNQKIYPESSLLYDALKCLYLEAGMSIPSTSLPFSAEEILLNLGKIDPDRLSAAGKHSYDYLAENLKTPAVYSEPDGLRFNASVRANVEGYIDSNPDYPQWEYGYKERKPLIDIPLEIWVLSPLYALMEPCIKKDPFVVDEDPHNHTNVITDLSTIDAQFPFRALLSLGGSHWNVQFGRDLLSWGNGRTGNLMLSDNADFHDYLSFSTYWRSFKFSTCYISLENWKEGEISQTEEESKSFLGHRIEVRFWDRVNLAVSESLMLSGKYLELRYLNPFMIYHGWMINDELGNVNLAVELEVNPYRWINIYGQWCADQLQAGYERRKYSIDDLPSAYGYLLGADFVYPLGKGYLSTNFEWVLTDPWFYLMEGQPDYIITRRVVSNFAGRQLRSKPIGYALGPDCIVESLMARYRVYGRYSLQTDVTFVQKGEIAIDTDFQTGPEAARLRTPTGTVEYKTVWHLGAEVSPWKWLSAGMHFYWIHVLNYRHQWGSVADDIQWVPYVSVVLQL